MFVKVSMNAEADPAYIHSRVRVYVLDIGSLLLYDSFSRKGIGHTMGDFFTFRKLRLLVSMKECIFLVTNDESPHNNKLPIKEIHKHTAVYIYRVCFGYCLTFTNTFSYNTRNNKYLTNLPKPSLWSPREDPPCPASRDSCPTLRALSRA